LVGFAGVVAAVAAAGHAYADPPWSDPRPIGGTALTVGQAAIAFAPDGTALLSRRVNRSQREPAQDRDLLATLAPAGTLSERGSLPDHLAAPPVMLPGGRVALLREPIVSDTNAVPRRIRLSLSVGSIARPVPRGRPRRVAAYTRVPSDVGPGPAMAVGPRGRLAIVWMAYRGDEFGGGHFRVRLAVRRPDGRFERTRTVASGALQSDRTTNSVAVAFGARRDIVVAYELSRPAPGRPQIIVRTLRRGRRFDRPQVLGPHAGLVELEVQASPTGRAIVAWATQDGGEQADTPSVVRAAIRAPRARRFGPTRVMDPGDGIERVPGRLCLAMAPDGSAVLAWSNVRGRYPDWTFPARVAIADAGADFGPVTELAANGGVAEAVARGDGAMLVSWTRPYLLNAPPQTHAALRAGPGQSFGPPELIAESSPQIGFDRGVEAAFDPRTGRPSVVWIASGPGADALQLATRIG
jgi:hypothetical protein